MKHTIKIAVIGGTGKSGKFLVKQLISQGFSIKLLLRNPENFLIRSQQVEIVEGNVTNYAAIHQLMMGCQAVISTLGLGNPPSDPTIFSQATRNVLKAMNDLRVNRYILTTGLNVDTPFDKKGPGTTYGTDFMKKTFPVSTADKQSEYELLTGSKVDWTLVRLPLIELTDDFNQMHASLLDCPGDKIGANDLAIFLIEQLFSETFVRKAPFLANI